MLLLWVIFRCVFFLFLFHCLVVLLFSRVIHAQEPDDTRRQLERSTRQQEISREHELLEPAAVDERPTLIINGQTYIINNNTNDVGRALYLSIQQRKWNNVAHFLEDYIGFTDADPLLVD